MKESFDVFLSFKTTQIIFSYNQQKYFKVNIKMGKKLNENFTRYQTTHLKCLTYFF